MGFRTPAGDRAGDARSRRLWKCFSATFLSVRDVCQGRLKSHPPKRAGSRAHRRDPERGIARAGARRRVPAGARAPLLKQDSERKEEYGGSDDER